MYYMNFSIVVCTNNNNGIGLYNGTKKEYTIPWKNKEDMSFFKMITTKKDNKDDINAVIMGRNTYTSISEKFLVNRKNIVLTKSPSKIQDDNITTCNSLNNALIYCKNNAIKNIFIIGGSQVYREALQSEYLDSIYWNIENNDNRCNIHFPLAFQDAMLYYNIDSNYEYSSMNNDRLKYYKLSKK